MVAILAVTDGKLRGLHEAIASGGRVKFKNGSIVRRNKLGGITVEWGRGKPRIVYSFGASQLAEAYDCALNGLSRPRQPGAPFHAPASDGSRFGDDPPF
jgi:hypothetical protein